MIVVENRELVVPGEQLAEGDYLVGSGAFREGERVFASVVGLADIAGRRIRVIPLQGPYIPREGDLVIGIVVDVHPFGWLVDINSPYFGNLLVQDYLQRKVVPGRENLKRFLQVRDVVALRVKRVDEKKQVLLEGGRPGLGKLRGGKLVEISPMKVPRVLGKRGSMLGVLQRFGRCRLTVANNGRIMVWGSDRDIARVTEAILRIEREAHISGLTDRIKLMLEKTKEVD
jgi:exosome complex component RRP4